MSYPGGKSGEGVFQTLINGIPPHNTYIEAFIGAGAVMRHKKPAAVNIGLDLNPDVIARWSARAGTAIFDVSAAPSQARRDRVSPETARLATPANPGDAAGSIVTPNDGARFDFRCEDAIDFLASYRFAGDEMVYCDPPYLLSARSSCDGNYYGYEMTDVQHRELLRRLKRLNCNVMLSGYSAHLYDKLLTGWRVSTFTAYTHGGRPRTEHLWCNYPAPMKLHDYGFLGADYREREQIKRQVKRWSAKLKAMPPVKQQALLAAIAGIAG